MNDLWYRMSAVCFSPWMVRGHSAQGRGIFVENIGGAMAKEFKLSMLFRYFFLYSLLGYSAFLVVEGQTAASGAVLGGSFALFSLQRQDDEADAELEDATDDLRLKLLESQHEVEYYRYKLIESDLRTQYQGIVTQNMLEIDNLKRENHGFATTVSEEQHGNTSKAQTISYLESENTRLREQISKMEKDRILTMKRSVLKGMEGGKSIEIPVTDPESNIIVAES